MAEIHFKAFVSCSFASEDSEIVEFFTRLLKSFDIDPLVYDYQELGQIPDKIKEHILASDCLIAIATRRTKLEGSDLWTCPDWIHHELALANAYKKPIAIFLEDGVRIDGLIAMEERREKFCRSNLLKGIDKITKFIFSIRSHLESTYRFEKLHVPVLLRHYLHVREEVVSEEVAVKRCEVLMECLADRLEATHHSITLEDMTPGLSISPTHFDFVCKEIPTGLKAQSQVIQDSDRKHLWKIVFDPPLTKGDRVRYAFKSVHRNTRPFTHAELMRRIQAHTYEYDEPKCEACEWCIAYPTAEFSFDIQFPEDYELAKQWCDVRQGEADIKAENELRRVTEAGMYTAEKIIDRWTLSLKVPKPLQDHTYYIYYTLPQE